MAKKKDGSISALHEKYVNARTAIIDRIEELRLETCLLDDCKESDLPNINRILVVGTDEEDNYWIFDDDAFYWSTVIGVPSKFDNGQFYIKTDYEHISNLSVHNMSACYVVISPL